nr:unnamed protein product [Digitaria exilis]
MASTGLYRRLAQPTSPEPSSETRDWAAELPRDVLLDVFLRLGCRDIMRGAELACAPWRRVAVGEPELWRTVDMATMVRAAVDRGAGQCVAFAGPVDDDALLYLVER